MTFDDFDEIIDCDLGNYSQWNPAPKTLTIVLPNGRWRHYELGEVIGFVVYNEIEPSTNRMRFEVRSITEDDGNYAPAEHPFHACQFWVHTIQETYNRLCEWCKEHLYEGWPEGTPHTRANYRREVIKPIVSECVKREQPEEE